MARIRACGVDDLECGQVRRIEAGDLAVALIRCDDGFHAVIDNCSHEDYPLSEGDVYPAECEIECMRHGSTFSLLDGEPQSLPATRPIAVFAVEVEDGSVFVEVP